MLYCGLRKMDGIAVWFLPSWYIEAERIARRENELTHECLCQNERVIAMHVPKKCQYCGGPSERGYTCEACEKGWPYDKCKCENNGDFCESCEAYIEARRESNNCSAPKEAK